MIDQSKMMFLNEAFDVAEGFNVSIYVFFQRKTSAIGLDILEGMQRLIEKSGRDLGFKVKIIFTQEGGSRLSKAGALNIIQKEAKDDGISKIFVCGPPPQNIMFNELKADIQKAIPISPLDIVVL